jgi:hypothetical protein
MQQELPSREKWLIMGVLVFLTSTAWVTIYESRLHATIFTLETGLSDSLSIATQFRPTPMAGWHPGSPANGRRPWSLLRRMLLGLMLVMFVMGLMSLVWMGGLTIVIFLEKVTRYGPALSKVVGGALIILGVAILLHPSLMRYLSA